MIRFKLISHQEFYSLTRQSYILKLSSVINENLGHEISYLSSLVWAVYPATQCDPDACWETTEFCVKSCNAMIERDRPTM